MVAHDGVPLVRSVGSAVLDDRRFADQAKARRAIPRRSTTRQGIKLKSSSEPPGSFRACLRSPLPRSNGEYRGSTNRN